MDNHENQKKFVENENEMNEDQRVKVLSPGLLVFKRFVRNRLAIVGVTILVVMILFSFLGVWISFLNSINNYLDKFSDHYPLLAKIKK